MCGGNDLSIQFARKAGLCFAFASLFTVWGAAQQTAPPPNGDSPAQDQTQTSPPDQKTPTDKDKGTKTPRTQVNESGTTNDRLFYTLPNFLSINSTEKLPPMTAKQKYAVVARGTFDYVQYPWWAFLAAIGQANNSEPGYGQGWDAYGKRFGTQVADGVIENFMTGAVMPSLLHQDPRFYASSKGGFARRTSYAVSRIFVTRSDSGHSQFNASEIVGSAMSASISTFSYHPRSTYISTPTNPHMFVPSDRTLKNAADVWGTQVAYDTLTIVVKEFWPDIHRKLARKQKVDAGSTVP
jgi:hypothetical protein